MENIMQTLEDLRFFGNRLINFADMGELSFRFVLNIVFAFLLVYTVYYRIHRDRNYLFTFFLFNITIFFTCALLRNIEIGMGFAFGLFALFGILRYRTDTIPIKKMTYLFMVIGLAIINSLAARRISYAELLLANVGMIFFSYLLEKVWKEESFRLVNYEKVDLIKPENQQHLLEDLRKRTGLDVYKAEVYEYNFLRDTARLKVYYHPQNSSRKT